MVVERTACDCSPECCKANDTSNHYHIGEDCFHSNEFSHKTCDDDSL
jgi:hypothetical protein